MSCLNCGTTCDACDDTGLSPVFVVQGEYKEWTLQVVGSQDGAPLNLDGVPMYFTVRARIDDEQELISKRNVAAGGDATQINPYSPQATAANTGRAYVYLQPEDTINLKLGDYWVDAWAIVNNQPRVVLAPRRFIITKRVSHVPEWSAPAPTPSTVILDGVDLLFGDSTMNGYGDTDNADTGLSIADSYSAVAFAGKSANGTLDPMVWVDTLLGNLRPRGVGGAANMGLELAFGRYMDLYGGDVGTTRIAKVGINGSPLGGTQGWLPSATFPVTGGNIYSQAVAHAQSVIAATGKPARSIVVMLGVNDGASAPTASALAANMTTFMAAIRSVFGPIPLIWGRAHSATDPATCPHLATVIAQQIAYAATDSNCVLVSLEHAPLGTDSIHRDANGDITAGNALARALADKLRPSRSDSQASTAAPWVQATHEPGILSTSVPKTRAPDSRAGDLQILILAANDDATPVPAPSTLNGFISLASTQLTSTALGVSINTRLYTREVTQINLDANGGRLPDPVLSDNNDENVGRIITLRGPSALTAANIELVKTQVNNAADLAFTVPGDTTSGANRLLLAIEAANIGGAPISISGWSCVGATSVAEVQDSLYIATNKTHIGIAKAVKLVGGAFGPFTAAFTASYAVWAGIVLVVKP